MIFKLFNRTIQIRWPVKIYKKDEPVLIETHAEFLKQFGGVRPGVKLVESNVTKLRSDIGPFVNRVNSKYLHTVYATAPENFLNIREVQKFEYLIHAIKFCEDRRKEGCKEIYNIKYPNGQWHKWHAHQDLA